MEDVSFNGKDIYGYPDSGFNYRILIKVGVPKEIVAEFDSRYEGSREDQQKIDSICKMAERGDLSRSKIRELEAGYRNMKAGKRCFKDEARHSATYSRL